MNLDELRTVQSKERQTDSLQHLRPSFYQEVADYIQARKDERNAAAAEADDPFSSPEVSRLTDEIETAKDVVEAIYERRMGKLVKQASLSAAGMPANDDGLTAEEADLFGDLVARIKSNKGRVLEVLEGGESTSESSSADTEPRPEPEPTSKPEPQSPAEDTDRQSQADATGVSVADVMGGETADAPPTVANPDPEPEAPPNPDRAPHQPPSSDVPPPAAPDTDAPQEDSKATVDSGPEEVDRVTLQITEDIGSILGVDDREYTLTADDVITLPEQNATPLVERDAAKPLE